MCYCLKVFKQSFPEVSKGFSVGVPTKEDTVEAVFVANSLKEECYQVVQVLMCF